MCICFISFKKKHTHTHTHTKTQKKKTKTPYSKLLTIKVREIQPTCFPICGLQKEYYCGARVLLYEEDEHEGRTSISTDGRVATILTESVQWSIGIRSAHAIVFSKLIILLRL